MNLEFLKAEFSNKTFVAFFSDFYEQIDAQFYDENNEKVEKMSKAIASAWIKNNISIIEFEKKLPWVNSYLRKIKTLARDLFRKHSRPSR